MLRIARHSSLFSATLLQFLTPKILMSCHTHSSLLNLDLPTFLVPSGLVLNTYWIILSSLARFRCPTHSILLTIMNPIISGSLYNLYSSRLYFILHIPFPLLVQKLRSYFQRFLPVFHPISTKARSQRHMSLPSTLYIIIWVSLGINKGLKCFLKP